MNNTITQATDDELREWLQGEIQAALKETGFEWLEHPIELAVEETLEQTETMASEAETMADARHHIAIASRAAAKGDWPKVKESIRLLEVKLSWVLPGAPGSQARALQEQLDTVDAAVKAAQLEPSSPDWRAWNGSEYCQILLDQPYYQPWLKTTIEAWENGAELAINSDRLEVIEL